MIDNMSQTSEETTGERGENTGPGGSDRHRLLASERRRLALAVLAERTPPVELDDLAVAVARLESDVDEPSEGTVARVSITLHHCHLPMLADRGVIDYDPASNRVEAYEVHPTAVLDDQ